MADRMPGAIILEVPCGDKYLGLLENYAMTKLAARAATMHGDGSALSALEREASRIREMMVALDELTARSSERATEMSQKADQVVIVACRRTIFCALLNLSYFLLLYTLLKVKYLTLASGNVDVDSDTSVLAAILFEGALCFFGLAIIGRVLWIIMVRGTNVDDRTTAAALQGLSMYLLLQFLGVLLVLRTPFFTWGLVVVRIIMLASALILRGSLLKWLRMLSTTRRVADMLAEQRTVLAVSLNGVTRDLAAAGTMEGETRLDGSAHATTPRLQPGSGRITSGFGPASDSGSVSVRVHPLPSSRSAELVRVDQSLYGRDGLGGGVERGIGSRDLLSGMSMIGSAQAAHARVGAGYHTRSMPMPSAGSVRRQNWSQDVTAHAPVHEAPVFTAEDAMQWQVRSTVGIMGMVDIGNRNGMQAQVSPATRQAGSGKANGGEVQFLAQQSNWLRSRSRRVRDFGPASASASEWARLESGSGSSMSRVFSADLHPQPLGLPDRAQDDLVTGAAVSSLSAPGRPVSLSLTPSSLGSESPHGNGPRAP